MLADTIWHTPVVLAVALSFLGCANTHTSTDGSLPDGSVADGSSASDCESFRDGAGAPCTFEGTCVVPPEFGDEVRECCSNIRACEDGVATVTERCAGDTVGERQPWNLCETYLSAGGICSRGGLPGDPCDMATFGECTVGESPPPRSCTVTVTCVDDVVVEACSHTACIDEVALPTGVEACRSDGDCTTPDESCFRDDDELCGPCMTPTRECESDEECATGAHCVESRPTCSCGGLASTCQPACSAASECGADELCQGDGRCVAVSCEAGFDCPENTRCATDGSGDAHNCARLTCTADSECDCGFCVRGACASSIGTCMVPPA